MREFQDEAATIQQQLLKLLVTVWVLFEYKSSPKRRPLHHEQLLPLQT
jgi:hypothetical protein